MLVSGIVNRHIFLGGSFFGGLISFHDSQSSPWINIPNLGTLRGAKQSEEGNYKVGPPTSH